MPECKHYKICGRTIEVNSAEGLCILHSTDPAKDTNTFTAALASHRERHGDNFALFVFPIRADFRGTTFGEEASFYMATFAKGADFRGTTFGEEASFYAATFSGGGIDFEAKFGGAADFHGATFGGRVDFDGATFGAWAGFREATFGGEANFGDVRFNGKASLYSATFSEEADFCGATFGGEANFGDVRFNGKASLYSATFSDEADFRGATFGGGGDFGAATFGRGTDFHGATFGRKADFYGITFAKEASFYAATFSGEADFHGARFSSPDFIGADFRGTTFSRETHFSEARFSGEANFGGATFSGAADFARALFSRKVIFHKATFSGRTHFAGQLGSVEATGLIFTGTEVDFRQVIIASPDAVTFMDADLTKCRFQDTDLRKVQLVGITWPQKHRRIVVYDEIAPVKPGDNSMQPWPQIERLYRELKQNYEDRRDYERAGDFHYGEKEMRRQNPDTAQGLRFFLGLYKLFSGYGERYRRPLLWAALLFVGPTIGYLGGAYVPKMAGQASHGPVDGTGCEALIIVFGL